MKTFRQQFKECIENGNCVLGEHSPKITDCKIKSYWCNKYLKRCSGDVCIHERETKINNN
jgi:hypothetical protein